MLVTKLTGKVESNDEVLGQLREQVDKSGHDLQQERERFNLRLTESQKYFEETLKEQEESLAKLRKTITDKEGELLVAENDLRELITRHERDIQKIMSKGEVNIQDPVIQMLEQKLKDTNEVLEGKIKVIEVLQKESSQKEKDLEESREIQKSFKEKLQQMSEQMMLFQANLVDMESQWQVERKKYEHKISELVEKHEQESTEKDIQIQSLKSSADQLEGAYNQSVTQYSALQERYHQLATTGARGETTDKPGDIHKGGGGDSENIETLQAMMKEKDQQLEELECLKQKSESLTQMFREKQEESEKYRQRLEDKEKELEVLQKGATEDSGATSKGGDTKMLKMKAQLTAKVKSLEKEIAQLKKVCSLYEKNKVYLICVYYSNVFTKLI
jgi:chromosome segregation ATPase